MLCILLIDEVVLYHFFAWLHNDQSSKGMQDPQDLDRTDSAVSTNIFTLVSYPLHKVVPFFFVQASLLVFYCSALATEAKTKTGEPKPQKLGLWLTGVLFHTYGAGTMLGDDYTNVVWQRLFQRLQDDPRTNEGLVSLRRQWMLRKCMD